MASENKIMKTLCVNDCIKDHFCVSVCCSQTQVFVLNVLDVLCDVTGLLIELFCRNKSSRTITYSQFKDALGELASKRFKEKSSEDAAREVHKLIEGKSPVISGVTVTSCFINTIYTLIYYVKYRQKSALCKSII